MDSKSLDVLDEIKQSLIVHEIDEIVIGYAITGKGTNTGFISPNGGAIYQGGNSSTWSTTSDIRIKKNIIVSWWKLEICNTNTHDFRVLWPPQKEKNSPQKNNATIFFYKHCFEQLSFS